MLRSGGTYTGVAKAKQAAATRLNVGLSKAKEGACWCAPQRTPHRRRPPPLWPAGARAGGSRRAWWLICVVENTENANLLVLSAARLDAVAASERSLDSALPSSFPAARCWPALGRSNPSQWAARSANPMVSAHASAKAQQIGHLCHSCHGLPWPAWVCTLAAAAGAAGATQPLLSSHSLGRRIRFC